MTSQTAPRIAGFRPAAVRSVALLLTLGLALTGCKTIEEPGGYVAGWVLTQPEERHPIMVSQRPATLSVRVPRGSNGLSEAQRRQVEGFLDHFRSVSQGNSRLVIGVPAGSPNEAEAMRAIGDLRRMIADYGFSDTTIAMEPYHAGRDSSAPIRLAYLQYVAEGPGCGRWPTNLARQPDNLEYANFGCAQQHNLAAQIANPADLLGPRTMTPSDPERRHLVIEKYERGQSTAAQRPAEQNSDVKGN